MSNVPENSEKPPIGVIGAGWVGLVTACCFAELGHEVVVREILQEKVDVLSRGDLTMHEPGLSELLKKNIDHMTFTTDMGELLDRTRLMFVCVDTPPTYSGDADLSRVQNVVRDVGDSNDHALIMKSTVPVGTGAAIRREKHDLSYVSCPEFLKEGTAVDDFMRPDRVVVVYTSQPSPADIFARGDEQPIPDSSLLVRARSVCVLVSRA